MALTQYPVNAAAFPCRYLSSVESEFQGVAQLSKDGKQLWSVSLLVQLSDMRAETVVAKIPGPLPKIGELAICKLLEPVVSYWNQNGRSGVSLKASGIIEEVAPPGKAAATPAAS